MFSFVFPLENKISLQYTTADDDTPITTPPPTCETQDMTYAGVVSKTRALWRPWGLSDPSDTDPCSQNVNLIIN